MPTNREKNKLPFEIRKMYNQSVEIHQQIVYYEMEIISEKEFISKVEKAVKKYEILKDNNGILP